jgi:hypothetical protein
MICDFLLSNEIFNEITQRSQTYTHWILNEL